MHGRQAMADTTLSGGTAPPPPRSLPLPLPLAHFSLAPTIYLLWTLGPAPPFSTFIILTLTTALQTGPSPLSIEEEAKAQRS